MFLLRQMRVGYRFRSFPDASVVVFNQIKTRETKRERLVIEFPPSVRSILDQCEGGYPVIRELAFPYVYLVAKFIDGDYQEMNVFFRNNAPTNLDRDLYWPMLPNVFANGSICMPGSSSLIGRPFTQYVEGLISIFWSSPFKNEAVDFWDKYRYRRLYPLTFAEWELMSKENPSFITKLPWIWSERTLDSEFGWE